ncbi:MAG TPA: autotransporter-associated beta strand repeat-containing protein, partial [Lacipirellulaceae bacterium]|nr:autotransporter-associated beta strand repeat-containing protein [Lacipirellulaceae bacterium]
VWNSGSSLGIHIEPGIGDATAGIVYSGAIGNFHSTSASAGDFNHNGTVDAADYVIWRKGASPNPNSPTDYNTWRSTFGQTGGGSGTTNNVGVMKRGYGTLTLSGANTYSGQLKVNDEGGTLRLTSVQTNAGQSMALPAVYIGNALNTTPTILKVLTNNALPANSLIRFGSGVNGGINPIFRLHDEDPVDFQAPGSGSFNQTVRGFSGGNGLVQVGVGTLTIDTPASESYSFSGTLRTDFDANTLAFGTVIKTGAGEQDFNQINDRMFGQFILQQGTVGIGDAQIFGPSNTGPYGLNHSVLYPRLEIDGGALKNIAGTLNMSVPLVFIGGSFDFDSGNGNTQFLGSSANPTVTTLTVNNPTINVTTTGTTALIFAHQIQDDGTPRGFTKSGPGLLTLGGHDNSYGGDTVLQQGTLRLSNNVTASTDTGGEVPTLGNQTSPGTLVLAGGKLDFNGKIGTIFADAYSGTPYNGTRTNIESNPISVTASSIIAYASSATGITDDVNFVFTSNSVAWTSGTLTFQNNNANSTGDIFKPTFSGSGFNYGGPVALTNNTNGGKTVLVSNNTSGTQTWSGVISGDGGFLRDGTGTTLLSGINNYTGDTTVLAGTLSITHSYLADAADVYLTTGATMNLNFAGTDTIDQLFFDNSSQVTGTWGAIGSSATHQSSFFTGSGILMVSAMGSGSSLLNGTSAVPEPATVSLLLFAAGAALVCGRRKR